LIFGAIAATRRSCASPAGVMEQEQQFLQSLGTVATLSFEANRLDLRTADDALAAVLIRSD
jgi:heat shock protein HslJ